MNWIQLLKAKLSMMRFRKQAQKVQFSHAFVDLEKATSIGFIINIDLFNADDLVYFTKYFTHLEDRGKEVAIVEITYSRKATPMFRDSVRSIFLNPAQVNWLQFPSVKRQQELNAMKLDILLNLDTSERLTSRFICGLSNARTRAGLHEEGFEEYYELMLQLSPETKLHKILDTFEHFSKMLEKE